MLSIDFKDPLVLKAFLQDMDPKLQALFMWVVGAAKLDKNYGIKAIVVTCAFEERDYSSVHAVLPYRGIDIRSHIISDPKGFEIFINSKWIYDPKRPHLKCATYHDTGRGPHIHLQVHPNTRKVA